MLSIGKVRGLQQLSSASGIFTICAMDHRGSLKSMLAQRHSGEVTHAEMVEFKLELCAALAPCSTAVLLDPDYGAAQCIASGVLPADAGLLISAESSGYLGTAQRRVTTLQPEWSAAKARRAGASGAKLLLHYRPDLPDLAAQQRAVVNTLADDCLKHDLPCIVEPRIYPIEGEDEHSPPYNHRKPELVIQTARDISALPIDILKSDFPADPGVVRDDTQVLDICRKLDGASRAPWVVLSAGVDFETFCRQVHLACQAGASGFLGGRAIWQEAARMPDKKQRMKFLTTTAADRMKRLTELAENHAVPWHKKLGLPADRLTTVPPTWARDY